VRLKQGAGEIGFGSRIVGEEGLETAAAAPIHARGPAFFGEGWGILLSGGCVNLLMHSAPSMSGPYRVCAWTGPSLRDLNPSPIFPSAEALG
jgi:hypothetical protein